MRNRIVQSVVLAAALFVVSAIPARAEGTGEVGISTANKDVGFGVNGEYTSKLKDMGMDRSSSWLIDGAFLRKSFGGFGSDFSVSAFEVQGGWRFTGKAGDKASWHVQVAAGISHVSVSLDTLTQNICDLAGISCSASSTDFVITPAGAFTYWFSNKTGVKGQINIPIAGGDSFERFDIDIVFKL